jgi:8-oxo-dGTP pyrophosphatase MutT (NUDIX family)
MAQSDSLDLQFENNAYNFKLRTAAIVRHKTRVLLANYLNNRHWGLLGGCVQRNETGRRAIRRELLEELGEEINIGRFVGVIESFFRVGRQDRHTLYLTYEVSVPRIPARRVARRFTAPGDGNLSLKWFTATADGLRGITIRPAILKHLLLSQGRSLGEFESRERTGGRQKKRSTH